MRVVKVLFLILFFFFCMLFFVQNTEMLATPLVLKMEVFSWAVSSTPTPFYVVLLISFVVGGLFATLYFIAERMRLNGKVKELSAKVASLDKQRESASALSAYPMGPASDVTETPESGEAAGTSETAGEEKN